MLGTPCPLARVQWLLLDDGSCLFASHFVIASLRALLAVAFFGGRPSTASFAGGLGAEGPAAVDPASCLCFSFFSFFSSFFWRARRAAFPAGGFSAFALPQTQSLAPARPPIAREPQRACAAQRAAFFSEIRPEDQIKSDQIRSDTGLDAKTQIQIRPDTSPKKHRSDQTGAYSDKTKPDGGPNR